MPRVKLNELKKYRFRYKRRFGPRDITCAGHMNNDALVSLLGLARAEMFRTLDLNELDLGDGQTGIIVTDLVINYRAEAFVHDDLLVETDIGDISEKNFRMFQRATRGRTLVALAEQGISAYSYGAREVTRIPESFLKALETNRAQH